MTGQMTGQMTDQMTGQMTDQIIQYVYRKLLHFLACSLVAPDLIFYRIILCAEVIVYQADLVCF